MMRGEPDMKALAEIAELEQKIRDLKEAVDIFQNLSPVQKVAVLAHHCRCHGPHYGQCRWLYELDSSGQHIWTEGTHYHYLNYAESLLAKWPYDRVIEAFEIIWGEKVGEKG